jgi:hypothetical protein
MAVEAAGSASTARGRLDAGDGFGVGRGCHVMAAVMAAATTTAAATTWLWPGEGGWSDGGGGIVDEEPAAGVCVWGERGGAGQVMASIKDDGLGLVVWWE